MRILLAVLVLLAFPGLAEARPPVCGPTKARTLASSSDARLYKVGTKTSGCSRGRHALSFGNTVTKVRLAGHFAAIAHTRALDVVDLRSRRTIVTHEVNGRLRGLALSGASAAWIEDHADGRRELRDSGDSGARDSGRAIDPAFVHVAENTISWKKGGYVKFAMHHGEGAESSPGSLGKVGDVELSVRGGSLYARFASGRQAILGETIDDGQHDGGEGATSGVEALRVAGGFVAVRMNPTGFGYADVGPGKVRVFDLQRGTDRTPCLDRQVWNFVLTPSGSVACVLVSTTTNRIQSEGAALDAGDRSVTDLDVRDGQLVWQHGGEPRTAPLPAPPGAAPAFPCGPTKAGTFASSDTTRVYADGGVARTCVKGSKRSVSFGDSRSIVDVKLNGGAAAVIREAGTSDSLRVYALSSGHAISKRFTITRFADIALSPAGVAVFTTGDAVDDTIGTSYVNPFAISGSLRITGNVVSWMTYPDQLRLQELTDDRTIDVPDQDGLLWQSGDVAVSLERGQLVARLGTGAPTVLGQPSTACERRSSCTGVQTVDVGGTLVGTRDRSGAVTVHDLASGSVSHPCPAPTSFFALGDTGHVRCAATDD